MMKRSPGGWYFRSATRVTRRDSARRRGAHEGRDWVIKGEAEARGNREQLAEGLEAERDIAHRDDDDDLTNDDDDDVADVASRCCRDGRGCRGCKPRVVA
jgi:hypothetical protein